MSQASQNSIRTRVRKLTLLLICLTTLVSLCFVDWSSIRYRIPKWIFWQTQLIFLIAVEIVYAVTVVVTVLLTPVLCALYFRGRRKGTSRPAVACGLLCALVLVLGLGMAEAVSAVWQYRSHRTTAMPVGGLRAQPREDRRFRFPGPPQEIELPTEFTDQPADPAIDLVVLGESSAQGVPFQKWLSIGKIIAWQLGEAIPARPIRLNVLAKSGDTLEKQHEALADLSRRPEILMIYGAHNEFQSRLFGSREHPHYFADQIPSSWDELVDRAERLSPLCGLIRESADKCRLALPPSHAKRHLVDVPVYTPLEYKTLLVDFRQRLEEIVSFAERVGALPILILPPSNDASFEPNRSFLSPSTPRSQRESFRRAFLDARRLEADDPSDSMKAYRALLSLQPSFAEAHYRLAQLLERASAWDLAYLHYVAARDLDGYPMRCPTPFQQVYRDVAARHSCILIDGQSYFHAIGRHGLLDDELFQDAMHPSLRGQIALAQAVLHALQQRRAFGWPKDLPAPVIDPGRCAAHFGIDRSAWKKISVWEEGFYSLVARLRYDTSERSRKIDKSTAAAHQIAAGIAPENVGLANVGVPAPVPLIPLAPIKTGPATKSGEPALPFRTERRIHYSRGRAGRWPSKGRPTSFWRAAR
ncbi:MAG: hypothetical protein ACHRXM_14390 [Isosphaerales bacterium]